MAKKQWTYIGNWYEANSPACQQTIVDAKYNRWSCNAPIDAGIANEIYVLISDKLTGIPLAGYPKYFSIFENIDTCWTAITLSQLENYATKPIYEAVLDAFIACISAQTGITKSNIRGNIYINQEIIETDGTITGVIRYNYISQGLANSTYKVLSTSGSWGLGGSGSTEPNPTIPTTDRTLIQRGDNTWDIDWGNPGVYPTDVGIISKRGSFLANENLSLLGISNTGSLEYTFIYYSCEDNKELTILLNADNGQEVKVNGTRVYYLWKWYAANFYYCTLHRITGLNKGYNTITISYLTDSATASWWGFALYNNNINEITADTKEKDLDILLDSRDLWGVRYYLMQCPTGYAKDPDALKCIRIQACNTNCVENYITFNIGGMTSLLTIRKGTTQGIYEWD
jgi:hypothetical protein